MEDLVVSSDFWRDKRVLVTGHSGFKGGWLTLWLRSLGAEVTGYALKPPTEPSLCQVAGVEREIEAVRGDIRDLNALQRAMGNAKPDIVFHLAAQALVRPSYEDPVDTYSTNVMGTVNLLEAVRRRGDVRAVVVVTSDKCYENRERGGGYREDEPMGGHDPYSNSKGCAELVTAAYRKSFLHAIGTAVATGRAGNVIGGGDWAVDRLIPDIIRAVSLGKPVLIRNPKAIRPWQHVLEPLGGYLLLAQKLCEDGPRHVGAWNFGPADEDAQPVQYLVEKITKLWGEGASWVADERQHPHEAHYLKLDCSKAHQALSWRPRLKLVDALAWTVDWYKSYQTRRDVRMVCQAQIEAYQRLESA
jgi:CDP-glucose 4,6-dehydratase